MRLAIILLSFVITCRFDAADATAGPPVKTFRYPRVYGATGRPYGPTQAHYQYQRQYGRPWHGYGGLTAQVPTGRIGHLHGAVGHQHHFGHRHHYGYVPYSYYRSPYYGYSSYGGLSFGIGYGPAYSYLPAAPVVIQAQPQFIGPNPFNNSVLNDALLENEARWGQKLIIEPQIKTVDRPIKDSTPAAKLKSLRLQAQGDEWFRKQKYLLAYSRYKRAATEADDRAEAHFRLAYALTALGQFSGAVKEFKRGLRLDPVWPVTGKGLSQVFGDDNQLAKLSKIHKVADWVREDIRDPDRLFLLGVLLHFDEDDRAAILFETALRLAGRGDHLSAFLSPPPLPHQPKPVVVAPDAKSVPPTPANPPLPSDDLKPEAAEPKGSVFPLPPLPPR